MKNSKICRFCLRAGKENFLPVREITKEILDVLLIKIDLDISGNPVMCNECIGNFQKCFEFKSVCILTEENVVDFLESRNLCKTNMTEVYLKDVKNNFDLFKIKEVCRFCSKSVTKFFSVDELDKEISFSTLLQQFLPEVRLFVTNNPVSCKNCLNSLKNYFTFLKSCQDVEKYIKAYCKSENKTKKKKVQLHNVVQYMAKHIDEKHILKLKKNVIDEVTIPKDQSDETYSSDFAKAEIIIKKEKLIEMNSADLIYMDAVTMEEQLKLIETFPSNSADTKKYIMKKRSNMNILLDEIMNNNSDDVLPEDLNDRNNTKDIDMTEIKMEDFDIKPNSIDLERSLLMKSTEVNENSLHVNSCREDIVESNTKTHKIDFDQGDDGSDSTVSNVKLENSNTNISYIDKNKTDMVLKELVVKLKRECFYSDLTVSNVKLENSNTNISHIDKNKTDMVLKELVVKLKRECFYRYEENRKQFQCSSCKYKSSIKCNLITHLKVAHRIPIFSCHRCRYKTHYRDCLKKHLVIHGDNAKYKCPECHKVFRSKSKIDNHFLTKHYHLCNLVTSKIHSCNICNYKTTNASDLDVHMKVKHFLLKEYQCNSCSHTWVKKADLKRHILLVHLKLRPHICKDCKKTFTKKTVLDGHIVSVHQQNADLMKTVTNKIYKCDHCTFRCVDNYVMKVHMKTHGKRNV